MAQRILRRRRLHLWARSLLIKRPIFVRSVRLRGRFWRIGVGSIVSCVERPPSPKSEAFLLEPESSIFLRFQNDLIQIDHLLLQLFVKPDSLLQFEIESVDSPALGQPVVIGRKLDRLEVWVETEPSSEPQDGLECAHENENNGELCSLHYFFKVCDV